MWKKTENERTEIPGTDLGTVTPQPVREQAVIGPSLIVKGDVTGEEDLTIQGQVEGKVVLKNNSVTVGKNGKVKADLYGKSIAVEGSVQGNLYGEEQIIVRRSGNVRGNLIAPRVTLEDGAKFKGSIDMESREKEKPLISTSASDKPSSESSQESPKLGRLQRSEKTDKHDTGQAGLGISMNPSSKK